MTHGSETPSAWASDEICQLEQSGALGESGEEGGREGVIGITWREGPAVGVKRKRGRRLAAALARGRLPLLLETEVPSLLPRNPSGSF